MRKIFPVVAALIALFIIVPGVSRAAQGPVRSNLGSNQNVSLSVVSAKIQPLLYQQLQNGESARALILMAEQADVSGAASLTSKQAKGRYVFDAVRAVAARTQAPIRALLDAQGAKYRAYYVSNVIAVEGLDAALAAQIAARSDVGRIFSNVDVHFSEPVSRVPSGEATSAIEWGITKIKADKLWQKGFQGKGIVVANQDTGVQWNHPALIKAYRGYDKTTGKAKNAYNWWDAIHNDIDGSSNPCGYNLKKPCDDDNHGTHTMGTMVGKAGSNQIGVAPKAKWISCRDMDSGVGRPNTYIECFEFFLAPWNGKGENPNPDLAPDIVSNSWGCPPSELCEPDSIKTATENVRAAGIFVSVSAGNSGSGCSTVSDPSAIYDASTTVGATNISDQLVSFSSRGPVTVDASNRRKPDISAPGENVRSSVPNNGYANFSGTSMAAPHVAGAVALLWDAYPSLIGDVDTTETVLFTNSNPNVTISGNPNQTCGGTDHEDIPNNLFGYGRLDVLKAYNNFHP